MAPVGAQSPTYTQGLTFMALAHYWLQQYDSAQVWADSVIAVEPNYLLDRNAADISRSSVETTARAIASFEAATAAGHRTPSSCSRTPARAFVEARSGDTRPGPRDAAADRFAHGVVHDDLAARRGGRGEVVRRARRRGRCAAWLARYPVPRDLHFQLHLRCEPPLAVLARDARYRAMLLPGTRVGAC